MADDRGAWADSPVHWIENDTAFVSIAFSYRLREARKVVEYYHLRGLKVRVGGPAVFSNYDMLKSGFFGGMAELPPVRGEGHLPDAVTKHNPNATFASRGCPVNCSFCIVPAMQGRTFTLIPDFVPRPVLCDNNLSALPDKYQEHIIAKYTAAGVPLLDANSGFEPRTFSDEVYARWKPLLKGPWRFAYDEANEREFVERVFKMLKDESPKRKQVYTLIGNEPFDACMERIKQVIAWGGEPYAQPVMKLTTLVRRPWVRFDWTEQRLQRVQRWCNSWMWRGTCPDFADYDPSAKKPKPRPKMREIIEATP